MVGIAGTEPPEHDLVDLRLGDLPARSPVLEGGLPRFLVGLGGVRPSLNWWFVGRLSK
jgi:hypothetical protein